MTRRRAARAPLQKTQAAGAQRAGAGAGRYLLCQMAGALRRVEDLVVKHREVERQAQPDRVRRCQVHQSDVLRPGQAPGSGTSGWAPRKRPKASVPAGTAGFPPRQLAGPRLGRLVRQQRVLGSVLAVGAGLELGQVAVVVALHFQVKHL